MAPKRPVEAIDLTGDDMPSYSSSQPYSHSPARHPSSSRGYANSSSPYRAPKQPRTSYNQTHRTTSGSSQAEAIFIDEDEEEDASQEVPDTTQGYNQQHYEYVLYGAKQDKIVGVRYYNGYATTGELVILRREPTNPYDPNAIRVDNVQGEQIGHLPRGLAAKLARYMDERSLLIEVQLTGPKEFYECPIELRFYGTNDPAIRERLMDRMKNDRLPVGLAAARQRNESAAIRGQERRAKEAAGRHQHVESSTTEFAAGLSQGQLLMPGPSMEDIIGGSERFNPRNVEEMVEEFGIKEEDLVSVLQKQPLHIY